MLIIFLIIRKYFLHSYLGKEHHLLIMTLKFLCDVSLEGVFFYLCATPEVLDDS